MASPGLDKNIASTTPPLIIAYHEIRRLQPDSKNPRRHSKRQIQQIANSIQMFGLNVPFLIDQNLRLIAGHGRLAACQLLGISRVPTVCLGHLTENQIRAFAIADNRLSENSTWDPRLLGEQLKALAEVELDFDLEITGFAMGEIDVFIEGLTSPTEAEAVDALPPTGSTVAVTEAGDVWLLGKHKLMCGDALVGETYQRLMNGQLAAAVLIDPPHNVCFDGHVTGSGQVRHKELAMAPIEVSQAEFTDFLYKTFANLRIASVLGSLHFVFMNWQHTKELLAAAEGNYNELKNICVWVKENGGLGSLYRSQHELVFVFKNGEEKHQNDIQLGPCGRYRTNVWQYPRVTPHRGEVEESNLRLHPTVKPVALVADAILDCTERGEIVLDPFFGSGTTLVAAERVGRICYGIELDPTCVDLAVRRWQEYTGSTAQHANSKLSFRETEEALRG
jgi:DNA modification methylase